MIISKVATTAPTTIKVNVVGEVREALEAWAADDGISDSVGVEESGLLGD